MKLILTSAIAICLVAPALGDSLGNPYDGATTTISLAQDFVWPGTDHLDTWVVSDFTTTQDYYLYDVESYGRATNTNYIDGEGANFAVYDGFPWDGGNIVLNAADGYDALHALGKIGATFQGQMLPAGSYYLVFQAVHNFLTPGGNTLMYHTTTGNNNDWQWNPGLGQNWGGPSRAVEASGSPIDVNWQLTAQPVPEPAGLIFLALAVLVTRRR